MKKISFWTLITLLSILFSCSTQKNTAITRAYHNLTAHYNVYFNGLMSYEQAIAKIDKSYKYDYSQLLPFFDYSNDDAAKMAHSDMNITLEKMGKTIAAHSITVKPKLKSNPTPKDRELMQKPEYCKWIDNAYLLMGKANLYNRDYSKALRAFRRILNIYKTEDTRFDAELWTAKVYIQQKKYKDAFNYLTNLENDVRHPKRLDFQINLTLADYYAQNKNYTKAISMLKKALNLYKKRKNKAKYYYILAQLEYLNKNNALAAKYFKKVIKLNPDYDMTFNAKIMRATVFSRGQNSSEIKKQLRKMLKDEKNEDYKDQIYYALAMISFKNGDTSNAVKLFKLSAQNSVSNNNQKAISYLSLADIFFKQKKFLSAGHYYDSTMQYLSPKYTNYETISKKANNTGLLVKSLSIIQNQDSLQRIAKMPKNKRLEYIDNIIKKVTEEEQQKKLQEQQNNNYYYDPNENFNNQNNKQGGKWYMYNPILVSRGENEFKKKWGNRKLEDNWRRRNKNYSSDFNQNENSNKSKDSTKITNNKTRKYYLQNLPLTDSLLNISNQKIENSLFTAAEVYSNMLDDPVSAVKMYEQFIKRFPKSDSKLEAYYRLYNLYSKMNNNSKANFYKDLIIIKFPDSKYAKALQDPNFINKLISTQDQALNLYNTALQKYNSFDYSESLKLCNQGIAKYPESDAFPNYLFIKGESYGSLGNKDSLNFYLELVAKKYPKTSVGKLSSQIIALIKSGKLNYNIYKITPNEPHIFIAIIPKKENTTEFRFKLKFQSEKFSDTKTFAVKSADFNNTQDLISVQNFDNASKAMAFYNQVNNSDVFQQINKKDYSFFVISKTNYNIFLKDKNIDKYNIFFNKNYKSLPHLK